MGKYERKNNKIIVICILLVSFGITLFSIYNFYLYRGYTQEKDELSKQLEAKQAQITEQTKENDAIEAKINELKNIDDRIEKLKTEVFKSASELEQKIKNKETDKKIAYLTFDDGPYYLTYKFLDVLKKHNVKGTFFTIGTGKQKCYDNTSKNCYPVYKEIVNDGHTIANHTYSHAIWKGLYKSTNNFITQVKKQEKLIYEQTGVTTNILRFPGGSSTAGKLKNSIIKELRNLNYGWVDWTSQNGDGGSISSKEQAFKNFKNTINENIEVVLFHDYNSITLSMLPDVIKYLEGKGYILLPLFYESVKINK